MTPTSRADPPTPEQTKIELILDAAQRATKYIESSAGRSVGPTPTDLAGLKRFPTQMTEDGAAPSSVLGLLDEAGSPATMVSTNGRYFGYVNGGTDPAAAAASVLVNVWDQNVALPAMSPVAAHLDLIASRWVVELLGLPPSATATFCSGASIANLTCILAARDALLDRLGWSVDRDGLAGAPPLRVVASAEIHVSVSKALRAAGIGSTQVEAVPVDDRGCVIATQFPDVDEKTIVLLQAGNVNTGHSDPFSEISPKAREQGAWVHIDGAFGLWAAASPNQRHLVEGVELADSWATDAHKWLNAPYDSGIAIVRNENDLRRALAFDAAYLSTDSDRALAHLGLQMSQRARAIETWAILASRGRNGIAKLVDDLSDHARVMATRLASAGAEILVPTALNQALVAFGDDQTTDQVIAAVQADGRCWLGGTRWHGRSAMRISICDASTTTNDIEAAAQAIIECHNQVRAASS